MKISTKAPKVGKAADVEYPIGKNLAENVELFGEAIVNKVFEEQLRVKVQAGVRKCLEAGADPQAWADNYKPGDKSPAVPKDPKAAARAAISQMSEEERLELIASLQAGLN